MQKKEQKQKFRQNETAEKYVSEEGIRLKKKKKTEEQLSEVDTGNMLGKEFRIMIGKLIQDLGKRMETQNKKIPKMFKKIL